MRYDGILYFNLFRCEENEKINAYKSDEDHWIPREEKSKLFSTAYTRTFASTDADYSFSISNRIYL